MIASIVDRIEDELTGAGPLRRELPGRAADMHAAVDAYNSVYKCLEPHEWRDAERWERRELADAWDAVDGPYERLVDAINAVSDWTAHRKLIASILEPYGLRARKQQNLPDARVTILWDRYE